MKCRLIYINTELTAGNHGIKHKTKLLKHYCRIAVGFSRINYILSVILTGMTANELKRRVLFKFNEVKHVEFR